VKETKKDISDRFIKAEMDKHFDKQDPEADDEDDDPAEDGAVFNDDDKRYRRYIPVLSKRQAYYPRPTPEWSECSAVVFDVCNHFRFRHALVAPPAVNSFICTIAWSPTAVVFDMHEQRIVVRDVERPAVKVDRFPLSFWAADKVFDTSLKPYTTGMTINRWREEGMTALLNVVFESDPDIVEAYEASESRARQLHYSITAPKNDSDILPRKSRNVSPDEQWVIRAWAEYLRLNGSLVPLQTIFGKSDGILVDFPGDADSEGGERPEAKYPLDSTLQNRPSVQELAASWPAGKYETRLVRCRPGGPAFQGFNPCEDASFTREMSIPISGSVVVLEYPKGKSKSRDDEADDSIAGYRQRYKEHHAPAHWPDPKRKTQKQIGVVRDRTAEQELGVAPRLLHISQVDKTRKWHISRIGKLHFAPNGHLIKYGTYYKPMVDVPRKAKGAAFSGSADQNDKEEMKRKGWKTLHPRETRMVKLPGAEHAEQRRNDGPKMKEYRKSYHGSVEHLPCHTLYHKRVGDPGRISYLDGLRPRETTFGVLARDYAFGKTYTAPEIPTDDVVERASQLAAVDSMLSPQGLLVANAIVKTERTPTRLASSNPKLGEMLWKQFRPGCELPSESTLERNGKKAREDTAMELHLIFQKLAAH
jgi:hypothetical protein